MKGPPGATIDLRAAQSPGYRGRGVARYALALTSALAEHHRDLVERVIVSPDLPPPDGIDGLSKTGLLTTARDWPETGGCYHLMAPFDPDVALRDLWPAVVTARRMRLVVTVHDLIPDALPDIYLVDPGRRRRYRARRELVRAADHVLTNSDATARDVERYLGLGPRRVTSAGTGCGRQFAPPPSLSEARRRARAALDGLGPAWVLYNGAVEPRKNTEQLVESYAALPPAVRDRWQLVIVCALHPLERHHFEVRARQLGIEGRLVLPGHVDDDTLVALNQGAELVAFPSLYEGYGLPVAEALACGAAVIASGNSALAELVAPGATFDPRDPAAITGALQQGLTDVAFRASLRAWATKPPPRWEDVARRTATCYRALSAPERPRRRTLALVTPWPPQRTGVADYSAHLVSTLAPRAGVELFIDGDQPGPQGLPPKLLPRAARYRGGYDGEVIALGNSEFHAGGLDLARHSNRQYAVLAHDVRLTGLYGHGQAHGAVPEGFAAAFAAMYPECTGLIEDGWVPAPVAARHGIFMARELIGRAGVFATTSRYAAALARLDAPPGSAGKVAVLPYAYPTVVPRRPGDEDPNLVCSFGIVNASKRPLLLIEAMALLPNSTGLPTSPGPPARPHPATPVYDEGPVRTGGQRPRLAFVGPASEEERQRIEAHGAACGVPVQVVGYQTPECYERWLRRAAVAVQLRQVTNGETSGAVADCLTHGVPTIVSDLGTARELPSSVQKLPPDAGASELAGWLGALLADPGRRRQVGLEHQRWAAERGFAAAADDLLVLLARRAGPGSP